ncbi:MAG: hypothetical protein ABR532_08405 [Candidatus Dormibacteria bacterium]
MARRSVADQTQILRNRLARNDEILGRELLTDATRSDYEKARESVVKALEALPAVCEACGTPIRSDQSLATGKGSQCRRHGAA